MYDLLSTLFPGVPDACQKAFRDHERVVARRIAVVAAIAALSILPAAQALEQLLYPGYQFLELHNALWRLPVMIVSLAILFLRWLRPGGCWPRPLLQLFAVLLLVMGVGIFARGQAFESDVALYTGQSLIINIAAVSITATRGLRDLGLIYGLPLLALPILLLINDVPLKQAAIPLIYPAMMVVVACIIAELLYHGDIRRFLAEQQLHHNAMTDPLTGLLNRRAMDTELAIAQGRAIRHARGYAVIMADLDHFKRINDEHGHDAGDEVLVELADRMDRSVRIEDRVARWGGEEFLLLIQDVDETAANRVATQVLRVVADTAFSTGAG
ncbi:MAG: GGDEF domain-containing protein, partial [Halofilum sp. (in: g-proteobacteria)]